MYSQIVSDVLDVLLDVSDVPEVELQVHNDYISCAELGVIANMLLNVYLLYVYIGYHI